MTRAEYNSVECLTKMAPQKWEYLILVVPTEREYSLDKRTEKGLMALERAGSEGWEAVGMSEMPGKWSVLMKRPLSS